MIYNHIFTTLQRPKFYSMSNSLNILISDDEKLNFILLKKLLQLNLKLPLNILHAINGKEAVELCNDGIHLILMDIEMPILNGLDASKIIKEKYANIPIIIQSAYTGFEYQQIAKELGCEGFLAKPIRKTDLLKMITQFIPCANVLNEKPT